MGNQWLGAWLLSYRSLRASKLQSYSWPGSVREIHPMDSPYSARVESPRRLERPRRGTMNIKAPRGRFALLIKHHGMGVLSRIARMGRWQRVRRDYIRGMHLGGPQESSSMGLSWPIRRHSMKSAVRRGEHHETSGGCCSQLGNHGFRAGSGPADRAGFRGSASEHHRGAAGNLDIDH